MMSVFASTHPYHVPLMTQKIIVRLKGGLGNQLFCYAAGRALALSRDAEFVLDTVSEFASDTQYFRKFALDAFSVAGRPASPAERLEPFGALRRRIARMRSRLQPFEKRSYLIEDQRGWDHRFRLLLQNRTITLDGYWQSPRYFEGFEATIRKDLALAHAASALRARVHQEWEQLENWTGKAHEHPVIALHVRWFDPTNRESGDNVPPAYYHDAISSLEARFDSPRYLVFSDVPHLLDGYLKNLPTARCRIVNSTSGDSTGTRDLMLMSKCDHFIIANSTFSWWAAWLGMADRKTVICPAPERLSADSFWHAPELLPPEWIKL